MNKIDEIKQALAKATPGPWEYEETDDGHEIRMASAIESPGCYDSHHFIGYEHGVYDYDGEQFEEAEANAHLIANAPEWLHYLIGEVERYKWEDEQFSWLKEQVKICAKENEALRKALEDVQEEMTDDTSPRAQRINKIIDQALGREANHERG